MADEDYENISQDVVSGRIEGKPCQPCLKKNASKVDDIYQQGKAQLADSYCEDCAEFQCYGCSTVHRYFAALSDHRLISVDAAMTFKLKYDMKGTDYCKEHNEKLTFLCENENKLCCSSCAVTCHRYCCNLIEIEEKVNQELSALPFIKQTLLEIKSETKVLIDRLYRTSEKLQEDATEVMKSIQKMQDRVNEIFDSLKKTASIHIQSFQCQVTSELDMKKVSLEKHIPEVEQCLSDITDVMERGTPTQMFVKSHQYSQYIAKLQEKIERNNKEFKDALLTVEFADFLKLPPDDTDLPGKLKMSYVPASRTTQESQKLTFKLMASVDLKKEEGDRGEPLYTGLDFMLDGSLVAADNKNTRCLLYNEKLQQIGSLVLSTVPHSVAVLPGNEIAMTCSDLKIIFFTVKKDNTLVINRKFDVKFEYHSITMIDNSNFLVGTVDDEQPVRAVSTSGEEKMIGINFHAKPYSSGHSASAYVKRRNKVVLTDRFVHTVYIYDMANKSQVEIKDEIIKEPCGVAVGPGETILVCSKNRNSITQISHTGQIISSRELEIVFPRSIAVSKDNSVLAVSNSVMGKRKLQLYRIDVP